MPKGKKWKKHGDHPEVAKLPGASQAEDVCFIDGRPFSEHGVAEVGPGSDYKIMVHPGDHLDGSGDTLSLTSNGMRYDGKTELGVES